MARSRMANVMRRDGSASRRGKGEANPSSGGQRTSQWESCEGMCEIRNVGDDRTSGR